MNTQTSPFYLSDWLGKAVALRPCIPCLLLAAILVLALSSPTLAQGSTWPPPTKFFQVEEGGNVQSPTLLTDSGGNLHAFWSAAMTEGQPMALYYSRWQDGKWTEPVDVVLSPDGGSIWPIATRVDENDYVQLFWMSGGRLWHSMAHASQLENARQWSRPDIVPTEQEPFTTSAVTQDAQGVWYLVYSNRALDTIFLLKSEDGANSWTSLGSVHVQTNSDTWVGYPGIVVAPDGALWVSWQEMESGSGRSKGLTYARSADGGASWSGPEQLVSGYYFGGFGVIDDIMVKMYGGGIGTGGRFVSYSYDNGVTWTESRSIGVGGGEGAQGIGLVRDSSDTWHFVIQGGVSFARVEWNGNAWLPAETIVAAETMNACCITPGKVTENAAARISDGNRIHVFFEQDNSILWYTSRELNAPRLVSQPLAPPQPAELESTAADAAVATPIDTPAPTLASTPAPWHGDTNPPAASSMTLPLLIALAPALLIVGAVVVFRIGRRRQ